MPASEFRRRLLKYAGACAACALVIYAMVYIDITLRARSAFLEGEKYMAWHRDPGAKKAYFAAVFAKAKEEIDREKASGKLGGAQYRQRLELEKFRRDEAVAESSLKYAYHWYKTVVELFSPPESRWVRRSRAKMAEAKALWMKELDEAKIPYEEYMLE